MPAVSKKQQRFFGMVRAAQKGEMENPSKEVLNVADDISVKDAKKFAKTKHKGLPEKKMSEEIQTEAKVEAGRSDYGKASVRNKRKFGKEGEPAVFDASGERGKMIDIRRAEHKKRRGVKEDYYSGTGEKVVARTKKWMDKKGEKGAPGLDAMKARTAEHKAKRGVKEDVGYKAFIKQAQDARERVKKKDEAKKKKDAQFVDTKKHGVKFYDKKGSGRIVKGKKIYS